MSNTKHQYHCFICGEQTEEVGLGYLQCISENCAEMFLPFKDDNGLQNLMLIKTPEFNKG